MGTTRFQCEAFISLLGGTIVSKGHFKSDGNGGYVISKRALAGLLALMTLLGGVVSVIAFATSVRADVDHLKENQLQLSNQINVMQSSTQKNQEQLQVLQSQFVDMRSDIGEIKNDVKSLLIENRPALSTVK